ncbi:hypothetical protein AB210_0513 [Acinetobacter baumannii AB210]|nr:hypothetical protein A1S_3574 [Acinetobacter baumannii ATCC 17978]EGK49027.1 hypothetical protein AB210_0513 [Acinetobacter baumannii AB210]
MIQQFVQVSCTRRWPYYTSLELQIYEEFKQAKR